MRVLVVNAGSSSVKLRVLDPDGGIEHCEDLLAEAGRTPPGALPAALERAAAHGVDAVGHRVVHGGAEFTHPVLVDAAVVERIERLGALAPLHQPPVVAGLRAAAAALPGVASVACFDTAFHATIPEAARTYAIPGAWRHEHGVRRYGFHGLAHHWAARRAAALVGHPGTGLRVLVAHLGSGASACATVSGRSVDTTMGFTPTAGLVMATRSGDVDPSAITWLATRAGLEPAAIDHALDHASGLLALAGTADMRAVLAAVEQGDVRATRAVEVWTHRARAQLAAMAAAAAGVDVLAFSGGVGENAPVLRRRVVDGLGFLGLALDPVADATAVGGVEADVSAPGAAARTVVVHAREDVVIAEQVAATLDARGSGEQ